MIADELRYQHWHNRGYSRSKNADDLEVCQISDGIVAARLWI